MFKFILKSLLIIDIIFIVFLAASYNISPYLWEYLLHIPFIDYRLSLRSSKDNHQNPFKQPPSSLYNAPFFQHESSTYTLKRHDNLFNNLNYVGEHERAISENSSIVDKAKLIALSYSINADSTCNDPTKLIESMANINKGNGCCGDHSDAFLALSTLYGINSREVHNTVHTFNEFYVPDMTQWVWIDTQFALMAKDNENRYLSLLDLKYHIDQNIPFRYDFFGNNHHIFKTTKPQTHTLYDSKDDFKFIAITLGNNVFERYRFYQKIEFLPSYAKELLSLILNIHPKYLIWFKSDHRFLYATLGYIICCIGIILGLLHPILLIFGIGKWARK